MASIVSVTEGTPTTGLVAHYPFSGHARDVTGEHHGAVHGSAALTADRFGRPGRAFAFDGTSGYIEIPDADVFSVPTTGQFSVSVWMRPDVLTFPITQGTGYVHWMGKGGPNQHEWTFRMYNFVTSDDRSNRTSFYLFNPTALPDMPTNLGAGSYVQEPVMIGQWIHYVAVVDYAADTITWFKNGVQRDQDTFRGAPYYVEPKNGTAPVRIGTRDRGSFFQGAIDDIRFYNRALTQTEIEQLRDEPPDDSPLPVPTLAGPRQLRNGDPLVLTADTGAVHPTSFRWFHNNVLLDDENTATLTRAQATEAFSGTYRLEALDGDGIPFLAAEAEIVVRPRTPLTTHPRLDGTSDGFVLTFAPDFLAADFWRVQSSDDLWQEWTDLLWSDDGIIWTAGSAVTDVQATYDGVTAIVAVHDGRPLAASGRRFWRIAATLRGVP